MTADLPRYSNDDLNVILQDWGELDPTQLVAINLARELILCRATAEQAAPSAGLTPVQAADRHGIFLYEFDFGDEGKERYVRESDYAKLATKLDAAEQAGKVEGLADLESDFETITDHNIALQSAIIDAIKIHRSFNTTTDMADWLQDELDALAKPTQPAATQQPVAWVNPKHLVNLHAVPQMDRTIRTTPLSASQAADRTTPLYAAPVTPSREVEE